MVLFFILSSLISSLLPFPWQDTSTHLKFSTSCHPQTDGQTEVTNRTLGTLLRVLAKKSTKGWDELLSHAEFAYNRAPSKATGLSPFQVVYGFNPCTPIDLTPLPTPTKFSWEAEKRVKEIQELHAQVRARIERVNDQTKDRVNKHRKKVHFEPGDLVWIHLRKERFPSKRRSKLLPRSDGPFKILERVNPNAYKVDLPGEYGVSATFNVADLRPYFDEEEELPSLRTNSSQAGGDDGDQPQEVLLAQEIIKTLQGLEIIQGSLTCILPGPSCTWPDFLTLVS